MAPLGVGSRLGRLKVKSTWGFAPRRRSGDVTLARHIGLKSGQGSLPLALAPTPGQGWCPALWRDLEGVVTQDERLLGPKCLTAHLAQVPFLHRRLGSELHLKGKHASFVLHRLSLDEVRRPGVT